MRVITILMSLMMSTTTLAEVGTGHSHGTPHGHSHGNGGHSHSKKNEKVDAKTAEKLARNKVRVLAFQDKIDTSWNFAKLGSAQIKEYIGKKEWLVTFTNEKGMKGKTLYIFLKLNGDFVAANFTGK